MTSMELSAFRYTVDCYRGYVADMRKAVDDFKKSVDDLKKMDFDYDLRDYEKYHFKRKCKVYRVALVISLVCHLIELLCFLLFL